MTLPEPFPTLKDLPLDVLRLDGGTQPRVRIDWDVVHEYVERMLAGDQFKPVTVFFDGTDHWVSDGFHRVYAAREAGQATIQAEVWEGTLEEAVWDSLGANKNHGLRRSNEDKARVVRLAVKARPDLSDSQIADHCGVSDKTAAKYRAELESTSEIPKSTARTGRDGRKTDVSNIGKSRRPKTYFDDDPPDAADPDDIPACPGGDGAGDASGTITDALGRPVEGQVAEAFRRRSEMADLMHLVSKVKSTVLRAIDAGDPLYADILAGRFQADCKNVYRQLRAALPYAACPYCRAAGCKVCHGRGWVGRFTWNAAPKELKGCS